MGEGVTAGIGLDAGAFYHHGDESAAFIRGSFSASFSGDVHIVDIIQVRPAVHGGPVIADEDYIGVWIEFVYRIEQYARHRGPESSSWHA